MKPELEAIVDAFKADVIDALNQQFVAPPAGTLASFYSGWMMRRVWQKRQDIATGGLVAAVEKENAVRLAHLLRHVRDAHDRPKSELATAIASWLDECALIGDNHGTEYRDALRSFEFYAGDHHCRRAWLRLLQERGFRFVRVRGKRKLMGFGLRPTAAIAA
jgi:hypothetical protein